METTLKKRISLKELNNLGNLVLSFKKYGSYIDNTICFYTKEIKPTYIYLHSYKNKYIVTDYVLNVRQQIFDNYIDAEKEFYKCKLPKLI